MIVSDHSATGLLELKKKAGANVLLNISFITASVAAAGDF